MKIPCDLICPECGETFEYLIANIKPRNTVKCPNPKCGRKIVFPDDSTTELTKFQDSLNELKDVTKLFK